MDLVDLSHSRNVLAALVISDVPQDVLETVQSRYVKGRLTPLDRRLEIIRAPELLTADPDRAKTYAHQRFALDPDSPVVPCYYLVIDERTAHDGSVLFVQQDWPLDPDDEARIMPEHTLDVFTDFILLSGDFERYREEEQNEHDAYDPPMDFENRPGQRAVVQFPVSYARLTRQDEDARTYELDPDNAQELGLVPGVEVRTVEQQRKADGTFGNHLYLTLNPTEIGSASDALRVWGRFDDFSWGEHS